MSGPGPEHPATGARFKFMRGETSAESADYDVHVLLAEGERREARLTLSRELGTATFEGASGWTEWETKTANALARTLLKGGDWPRRLMRWKAEK
jgi:hypothetical protein